MIASKTRLRSTAGLPVSFRGWSSSRSGSIWSHNPSGISHSVAILFFLAIGSPLSGYRYISSLHQNGFWDSF
jgi:hypothetical protein